jgi:ubiquinone/menaquinone biosynthesis C-methylase UbiE
MFVGSNNYKRVIAGDLSPTMLQETRRRCVEENLIVPEMIRFVLLYLYLLLFVC